MSWQKRRTVLTVFVVVCPLPPEDEDDPYELLGLMETAAPEDVRRAWKQRAWALHPDRLGDAPAERRAEAEWWLARVNRAGTVLVDPLRRRELDARRAAQRAATRPAGPPTADPRQPATRASVPSRVEIPEWLQRLWAVEFFEKIAKDVTVGDAESLGSQLLRAVGWGLDVMAKAKLTGEYLRVQGASRSRPTPLSSTPSVGPRKRRAAARCRRMTAGGKRCANAALPGALFCARHRRVRET